MSKPGEKNDHPRTKPSKAGPTTREPIRTSIVVGPRGATTDTDRDVFSRPVDLASGRDVLRALRPHSDYDAERAAFARLKPGLLETALGRFVVLVGEEWSGPFDDFRAAYDAGRRRFGPGPLYIKQILANEPVFEPIGLEPCPY